MSGYFRLEHDNSGQFMLNLVMWGQARPVQLRSG